MVANTGKEYSRGCVIKGQIRVILRSYGKPINSLEMDDFFKPLAFLFIF